MNKIKLDLNNNIKIELEKDNYIGDGELFIFLDGFEKRAWIDIENLKVYIDILKTESERATEAAEAKKNNKRSNFYIIDDFKRVEKDLIFNSDQKKYYFAEPEKDIIYFISIEEIFKCYKQNGVNIINEKEFN